MSDSKPVTGAAPIQATGAPENDVSWTNAVVNTVANGADTPYGPAVINLAGGATTTLTFSNGSLKSNNGAAITLAPGRVKGLYIHNVAAGQKLQDGTVGAGISTSIVTIGGNMLAGAARPIKTSDASAALEIPNGMSLGWSFHNGGAGYTVTASSTDQIVLTNLDGTNAAVVLLDMVFGGN